MNREFREKIQNPDIRHRSMPFWGWNETVEPAEIVRQINGMKEAGMGGFFIHSRDGLETEYLGEKWQECVMAAIAEAERLGMSAWLYDEDRWPSGTAGGRVPAMGDAYRCKGLTLEVCDASVLSRIREEKRSFRSGQAIDMAVGVTALYAAVIQGMEMAYCRRLDLEHPGAISAEEVLLVVRLEVSAGSEWFNNEAPPDNLNPDCVKAFIQQTHEVYNKLAGSYFGTTVPGIFTDEPSLHDRHSCFGDTKGWIPWTFGLASYFYDQHKYDFFEYLPYLYFAGMHSSKTRHDYWFMITLRFGESYFKTIYQWCDKHQLQFAGHFLQEEKMGLCTRVNGAVMPQYRYQHVPGIDLLCERIDEYITVKQCTSVAHQMGKPFVLSEMYGCTGWDFSFEGQKWIGDWQYVLGVTRRCQHMALYSLRGCRKRDYPPSFNYNTTWWKENHRVEDYFARLGAALEEGRPIRRLLLLHPETTVWSKLGVNPYGNPIRRNERDVPALDKYGDEFNELIRFLAGEHFDCDLGDEILIQEYGRIEGRHFFVGEAGYDVVVIPPVETMLKSTYRDLTTYLDQGGKVILIGTPPHLTEGSSDEANIRDAFLTHSGLQYTPHKEGVPELLENYRMIDILRRDHYQDNQVLYQLRETAEEYLLFIVNTDRVHGHDVTLSLHLKGAWETMNLMTGEMQPVTAIVYGEQGTDINIPLQPCDSRLYFISKSRTGSSEPEEKMSLIQSISLSEECRIKLSDPNVLTLDQCRYRFRGERWSEVMEVWQAQEIIRRQLQMRSVHRNGIEQRYRWIHQGHPMDETELELRFEFTSEITASDCGLAVERPEDFMIYWNKKQVQSQTSGWYLDQAFQTILMPAVKSGKNEIILQCNYRHDMELEAIYLLGDFSVSQKRILGKPVQTLKSGSWMKQGLYHYCGSVRYHYHYNYDWDGEGDELRLVLNPEAVYMNIIINGKRIFVPWMLSQPLSIKPYLHGGENEIDIELVSSPRNMLGPLHNKETHLLTTNDAAFSPDERNYSKEYQTVSYGLRSRPVINIMKRQER